MIPCDAVPKKVLVIEDDAEVRDLLTAILSEEGFEVETASDGVEGLKKTFQTTPDIVLTDVMMPRLNGLDYLRKIRPTIGVRRLPVIVVSALDQEEAIRQGFRCGATDYVTKPFLREEILAKVQMALEDCVDPENLVFRPGPSNFGARPNSGNILDMGKYWLLEEVAEGGMGLVFRARHVGYDIEVALKVLPPVKALESESTMRFLREVRIAAQLCHPHIVKVFDVGLSGVHYFYAMEFLPDPTLAVRLDPKKPIAAHEVISMGIQMASALGYMHDLGFLHRDIKPENIVADSAGQVKIIDFGLAAPFKKGRITETGVFLGTPGYVAPESISGHIAPHPLSDIYSLGATLYAMATGTLPFHDYGDPAERLTAQLTVPLPPAHEENPSIPHALSDVIGRMTARSRAARYADMKEVREALETAGRKK